MRLAITPHTLPVVHSVYRILSLLQDYCNYFFLGKLWNKLCLQELSADWYVSGFSMVLAFAVNTQRLQSSALSSLWQEDFYTACFPHKILCITAEWVTISGKCHFAASLALQSVPMTCLTLPMYLLGDSKNKSLQIPLGHQFLMNECPSPGRFHVQWYCSFPEQSTEVFDNLNSLVRCRYNWR